MTRSASHLKGLDYSVVQQCMHCGLCLPTCPTYDVTKLERHSPRGRISLMRAIADGELETTRTFAEEMYYCLGCLACMSALGPKRRAARCCNRPSATGSVSSRSNGCSWNTSVCNSPGALCASIR